MRLYESLYETAMKHELPRQTVEELVRIFGYDLDFQRRVSNGDSFEIFFAQDEEAGVPSSSMHRSTSAARSAASIATRPTTARSSSSTTPGTR